MNKRIMAISVLIAILFVGSIAGTIFYYNGIVNDKNSKITLMKTQITNHNNEIENLTNETNDLTNEITNLTNQISNLKSQSANLVPSLSEFDGLASTVMFLPFNCIWTSGSVTNTGDGTAYNAGLHVVAYTTSGTVINMTVPLADGSYSTDATTFAYIGNSSAQLGNLDSGQTAIFYADIYHEGTVVLMYITPVWTNSP